MSSNTYHFTPPTCTLEIISNKSLFLLKKNADRFNKFQFKLKFDDPRQPMSKQVTVQGNKQDLGLLKTAVDRYLQNRLQSSFQSHSLVPQSTEVEQHPYLASQGLTKHELFFGSLAHDSDRLHLTLGTVQLFDLVTALEAYQAKVSTITGDRPQDSRNKKVAWGVGIAASALAAISMATIFQPQTQQQTASQQNSPPQVAIPELNEITPPTAPDRERSPASASQLKEPLASAKKLPPPPAVETPKPKPDIPDPAEYPLADVGRRAGLDNLAKNNTQSKEAVELPIVDLDRAESELIIPEETTTAPSSLENARETEINSNLELDSLETASESASELATKNTTSRVSQIQEVTAYFQDRWQPPADLKQSLEYRLLLQPDGSIQRVTPLGRAARLYLNQTKIPLQGEQFISPFSETESSTVRLLLNPDGRVQAFME